MKKILNISFILFAFILFQNCEEDNVATSLDYVTFAKSTYSTGVDPGGSTTFDIVVYTANKVSSDKTFNIVVDASSNAAAGSYDLPATVTVPAGTNEGMFTVALSDVNLGIGVNNLIIKFMDNEGFLTGASTKLAYSQNCTEVTATLDLTFDRYGSEVGWEIYDSLGSVVASSRTYPDTGSGTSTSDTVSITLCSGRSYTFTATDSYGDGWGAIGKYTLTIGGAVKASGDGSLGGTGVSESTQFQTN
jgi:hypothetical protein